MTQATRPIDEARERLKLLSLEVKDLVEDGTFSSINDAIMEALYKSSIHFDFRSYSAWRRAGFQVRKGEKAFLLWARPKDMQRFIEKADDTDTYQFFPVAYLFSNAQVEPIQQEAEAEQAPEEPVQKKAVPEPLPY